MDPTFTLSYSEFCVANYLQDYFKRKEGYSLYIPLSRQEKGADLMLTKRSLTGTRGLVIQVKASRTYSPKPGKSKRADKFKYYTWFNTFDVPKEADYICLVGLYPPEESHTRKNASSWWAAVILAFSVTEMLNFIKSVETRKGKPDRMFGFGFNEPGIIFQTRGNIEGKLKDYSGNLLKNQLEIIKTKF